MTLSAENHVFSSHIPANLAPNRLTEAVHAARAAGRSFIDLTESNPTRAGFGAVGVSTRGRDTGDAQIFVNLVDNPRLDRALQTARARDRCVADRRAPLPVEMRSTDLALMLSGVDVAQTRRRRWYERVA